jgi:hypothetical protein
MNKTDYIEYNEDFYNVNQKYDKDEKYFDYDNIIILAHLKDESIYCDSCMTKGSVVIYLTNSTDEIINNMTQNILIKKNITYIFLDEIETYDNDFDLSSKIKETLKDLLSYSKFNKVITLPQVPINVDIQNRKIYDYIKSLKLQNHYIVDYRPNEKNIKINPIQNKILIQYSSPYNKNKRDKIYNTYLEVSSHVFGIKKSN